MELISFKPVGIGWTIPTLPVNRKNCFEGPYYRSARFWDTVLLNLEVAVREKQKIPVLGTTSPRGRT
ncbi:hypothetical protein APP_34770 [Aeribacillus pallidus]|nr:hypothetical protein APP_34770 [Aeribacillus pallidus]